MKIEVGKLYINKFNKGICTIFNIRNVGGESTIKYAYVGKLQNLFDVLIDSTEDDFEEIWVELK